MAKNKVGVGDSKNLSKARTDRKKKRTSIGRSKNSRPKDYNRKKSKGRYGYRGQGK